MENFNAKFKFFFLFAILSFIIPQVTDAALLYLEPDIGEYHLGETFIEEIRIDTERECINAVEVNLSFSNDILEAIDFSQGESILTLWVKTATINQDSGFISFIGGIPGEYCGRIAGDPGSTNLLGKIIFKVSEPLTQEFQENTAKVIFLDTSRVLLSDKLGTEAKLTTRGAIFEISTEKTEILEDHWQIEIEKDNISPEPFKIEIFQQPTVFEGKYFIIFFTTDKQTGIDYYEVKEGEGEWKVGSSPYLLEGQSLHSIIKVRAVDKAGNERIAEYVPPSLPLPVKPKIPLSLIIILILVVTGIIWCIIRKIQETNAQTKEF
ncbi:hypothetical protein AMJ50_02310 [Parcubacteria bacterium DG_74_3]|nr:MAG: hypothetical protein AMJ50_02310 [Parcubacteria bacterium DG_74_3]